jgi:hypothetical protein
MIGGNNENGPSHEDIEIDAHCSCCRVEVYASKLLSINIQAGLNHNLKKKMGGGQKGRSDGRACVSSIREDNSTNTRNV